MNKTINIALARPGTGKTWTACKAAREWIAKGKNVLFVVPTKPLANEVCTELLNLNPLKIESRPNDPSIAKLNKYLDPAELTSLIVCQHAAFHRCSKKHLRHWHVIIDELPHPVSISPTPIAKNQLGALQYFEVDAENKLKIKKEATRKLIKHVKDFEKAGETKSPVSLISFEAYKICKAALDKNDIYISDYGKDQSLIYYSEESGFLQRFTYCKEIHLLSATWKGSYLSGSPPRKALLHRNQF
ncbi:DEAD/DEAH box helicase [Pseudomonas uvaldensis]|uniref:DEAD/DEAH box helicase n=1 Tax=Pseudomonas uvaldensis TaxID=2878385 RepID=UPI001E2EE015|nr:DEAD/DEAH box helicase [Pseudomonas uvaldensis]MCE0461279.1 DEAD/DEAH box helicase family protein [Pseudomonas uvaldensis]